MAGQVSHVAGKRVEELRKRKDWTQGTLAYQSKVDQSLISRIETEEVRDVKVSTLIKLARALGVLPWYLLREYVDQQTILVPKVSIRASAGPGAMSDTETWPYQAGPEERRHNFIAIEVVGTCMEPKIPAGATVIVDKSASPRPGDIVVAIHKDETLVKELARQGDKLVLQALGPQARIEVTGDTEIVGVVKFWGMRP